MKLSNIAPRKIINFALMKIQAKLGLTKVWGYPATLIIDTINMCNLKCPLCPTGLGMPGRPKGKMEMALFKKIMDELGDYVLGAILYNWGEPLLNKDIYAMIEYTKQKKIKTGLSSNLNVFDEEAAEKLIDSGLDHLIVSLDGATEETYRQYRVGGEFQQVVENVKLLIKKKQERDSQTPRITWQFLVFKHNVDEIEDAKKMAIEIGVDDIDIFNGYLGGPNQTPFIGDHGTAELIDQWLVPNNNKYQGLFDYFKNPNYLSEKKCFFLWETAVINWDGAVSPCCCVYDPETDFGNVTKQKFREIWNNEKFQSSRAMFRRNGAAKEKMKTICDPCKVFKKPEAMRKN